jgi:hypothetical protein
MTRKRPRGMRLDSAAHLLYTPTMHGSRIAVARWHHHIHLIPGWLFRFICDRFERSVWAEFDTTEAEIDAMMAGADPDETFYEEDEPVAEVLAAYERGVKGVTARPVVYGWRCAHFSISATLPGLLAGPPAKSFCDCEMQPITVARP